MDVSGDNNVLFLLYIPIPRGLTKKYEMKVSRRFSLIVSQIFAEDISLNLNYLRNSADFSAYICEKEKSLFSQPPRGVRLSIIYWITIRCVLVSFPDLTLTT